MFQLANYLFYLLQRSFAEDDVHSLKKLKLCEFSYTNLLSSTEPNPLFSFKTTVKSKNLANQLQLETKHYEIYHDDIFWIFQKKSNSLTLSTNLNFLPVCLYLLEKAMTQCTISTFTNLDDNLESNTANGATGGTMET